VKPGPVQLAAGPLTGKRPDRWKQKSDRTSSWLSQGTKRSCVGAGRTRSLRGARNRSKRAVPLTDCRPDETAATHQIPAVCTTAPRRLLSACGRPGTWLAMELIVARRRRWSAVLPGQAGSGGRVGRRDSWRAEAGLSRYARGAASSATCRRVRRPCVSVVLRGDGQNRECRGGRVDPARGGTGAADRRFGSIRASCRSRSRLWSDVG
jgi:hypothetical protein